MRLLLSVMDTQKRNTITAAVSVVKGDDIVNRPITDLTSALQGNVAGLNFASDANWEELKGGELGTDIKFQYPWCWLYQWWRTVCIGRRNRTKYAECESRRCC